ncbi:sigma-70 family RNA polymerase sigma factor [Cellulomonas wangsupingiae]|uniref:Sigma-70 family RNA polymerase sigma factor n=1 Tax=Cellulomonas wangsupingiae TaxID=2968085 RepID=A0ABY5K158_9CELL|nr:sigma-70 family RNA polymerase sigma factor [Cellulomonas wangsupingiae]MCC2335845.1 sigma-70 family RNA polymerase sigma factor [Cellulomonas wangsupingiae]UUI64070.1 sigma-70 family RNA polymerase sigma factor [Cellulomonas wangsupingiae]
MARPWEVLLEEVARQRWRRLVTHATFVSGSYADAPDLVQEALISTFSGRARFTTADQAEAYVRRAIASRAVDASRRRARDRRLVADVAGRTPTATHDVDRLPGADVVRALATLSPRERACVVLRQMEDMSVAETATVLGLSEGAVKRYTADAVRRLGDLLDAVPSAAEHETTTVTTTVGKEVLRDR